MIYFARKPDAVCFTLLRLSLDLAEFAIRRDIDSFATTFPHVSRWSTPKRIAKDINWLQGLLVSPVVYRLTEAAMQAPTALFRKGATRYPAPATRALPSLAVTATRSSFRSPPR